MFVNLIETLNVYVVEKHISPPEDTSHVTRLFLYLLGYFLHALF